METVGIDKVLSKIQLLLKSPKGQYNSFGKYHYRSCEDILNAVKAVMPNGASVVCTDHVVLIGDRVYVKAVAKLQYGTDSIETAAYAREPAQKKGMDESQITGATSSYARKYALNGLFAIDDTKDADTQDNRSSSQSQSHAPEVNEEVDPADYIMTIGKFKGKRLGDINTDALISWAQFMLKKDLNGPTKEALAATKLYLQDVGR